MKIVPRPDFDIHDIEIVWAQTEIENCPVTIASVYPTIKARPAIFTDPQYRIRHITSQHACHYYG